MIFRIFDFHAGIPPPPVDIISILKNPKLYTKPLYGNEEKGLKENAESDLDIFCKSMGWINIDGVLPKKPEKKPKRQWEVEEIDVTDVHKNFTKTNVAKEMVGSILNGIQSKLEVKLPSEREAHRLRKVYCIELYKVNSIIYFNNS